MQYGKCSVNDVEQQRYLRSVWRTDGGHLFDVLKWTIEVEFHPSHDGFVYITFVTKREGDIVSPFGLLPASAASCILL